MLKTKKLIARIMLALYLTLAITPLSEMIPDNPAVITAHAAYNKATVKDIQKALNQAGYDCGTPDGIAGKDTKAAIKKYQKKQKLKVTGTVNKALLKSLSVKETKSAAPATDNTAKKDRTVYITKTGSKYHLSGCRYLRQSKIASSLSEAKKYYDPCSVCNP